MSRRDVVKSLLRSAATSASTRIAKSGAAESVRKAVEKVTSGRLFVPDAKLTAAVARVPMVTAATVSTRDGRMRVDLGFHDGPPLAISVWSEHVTFASHGAKEWCVRIDPPAAALDTRCVDVLTALAGEVARALWGPLLRERNSRSHTAFAHREHDRLIIDLRSLPEVRAALGQRVSAAGIDAFALQDIVADTGGLRLVPRMPSLQL
jgi:hypothetical protein